MSATGPWTRVILLTPPQSEGGGLSEPLQQEFAVRDWFAVQVHDPYLALTELFVREKAQATRSSWGLQRMEQLALVVTHAHNWTHIDWLAQSVRKYVPHASVWVVGDEQVRPFDGSAFHKVLASDQAPAIAEAPATGEMDSLGVEASPATDEHRSNGKPGQRAPVAADGLNRADATSDPDSNWQRISREEIDMLLDFGMEDKGDATARGAGA